MFIVDFHPTLSRKLDREAQGQNPACSDVSVHPARRADVVEDDLALVSVKRRGSADNRKLHVPVVQYLSHLILEIHDGLDVALLDSPKFVVL